MMYHCIPIDFRSPLDAKPLENVCHAKLHELVYDREKRSKERHRGDDHPGGSYHVFAARPRDLLHLHANVVQKFTCVCDRAGNFFADAGRCSGDGAALRFFVLHFDRLRGHESSFSPVRQTFLSVLCIGVRPANAKTLAGEEGFEPPYPVLETGVLAVGRLPFTPSPRSGTRGLPPSHQLQLLDSAPTFNLLLQLPSRFATSAALAPNQLNRPAFRGVPRSYAPVMPLHPLLHVVCNSDEIG